MKPYTGSGTPAPLFNAAVAATERLLEFAQPADATLTAFFRAHRSGTRDRAFIAEAGYAVLRRLRWLQVQTADLPAKAALRMQVALALIYQLGQPQQELESALYPAEQGWLKQRSEQPEVELSPELKLAVQLDFPDWLTERLRSRYSEDELLALAQGLNSSAPLDLRVNALKSDRQPVLAQMQADGLAATACPHAPLGIRLSGRPPLHNYSLFLDGSIEVQDEGSQLLGYLLQPKRGEMVVDFCAGAGGKTLLLGAMMRSTGRLYAFDVSEKRLAKLKPRAARAGLSNIHTACISSETDQRVKRLSGKIDRVLVDAPCSGLGTLRRNPDLKWRQTPESIAELVIKQAAILASASRLLKVGGRLVYATCSILEEENEAIVDGFLAAHPAFRRLSAHDLLAAQGIEMEIGESLKLWPHRHGTDGFFAVAFEKTAEKVAECGE